MEGKHTVKLVVDVLQQVRRRGHRQVVVAGSRPHKRPAAANVCPDLGSGVVLEPL